MMKLYNNRVKLFNKIDDSFKRFFEWLGWIIRNITRSIKNVIRWLPIIWKDRDWDYSFIFTILQTKLKHQSEYIDRMGNHESAKRDAEVMMLCIKLIDKVKDEYYGMEYVEYFKSEYEFIDSEYPGHKEMISHDLGENFDDYFKKYPLIYNRVLNGGGRIPIIDDDGKIDKKRIAMNIAHINHVRARKLLFRIMDEQIERWWN